VTAIWLILLVGLWLLVDAPWGAIMFVAVAMINGIEHEAPPASIMMMPMTESMMSSARELEIGMGWVPGG
jgi:hypothetical protein